MEPEVGFEKRGIGAQKMGNGGSLPFDKRLVVTVSDAHDFRKVLRKNCHVHGFRAPPGDNNVPVHNHCIDAASGLGINKLASRAV